MCGRFHLDDAPPEELALLLDQAQLNLEKRQPGTELKRGEVRPGDCAAVIAMSRSGQQSVFAMQWGFRMDKRLLINARSETALEKPTFRQSMQDRRCLIPVSAYFEWDHREKPLVKYRFSLPGEPMLYLAGLYRFEESSPLPVFTVLTREAIPEIACFHDRMPVIIPREHMDDWLDRSLSPLPLLEMAQTRLRFERT